MVDQADPPFETPAVRAPQGGAAWWSGVRVAAVAAGPHGAGGALPWVPGSSPGMTPGGSGNAWSASALRRRACSRYVLVGCCGVGGAAG